MCFPFPFLLDKLQMYNLTLALFFYASYNNYVSKMKAHRNEYRKMIKVKELIYINNPI